MALYPLATIAPCISYHVWDGVIHEPTVYNRYLITSPRIYDEGISQAYHFFYEPNNDLLVAYFMFNTYHWPGWALFLYKWDAGTGAYLGRKTVDISAYAYYQHAGVGSYNHIYCPMTSSTRIIEVPWDSLIWQSGLWSIDPYTWNPPSIYSHVVVNRFDGLFVGVQGEIVDIWSLTPTPTRKTQMRLPDSLGYMAYENQENLWIITRGGLIAKLNYKEARWEMLSAVQNPSADAINYLGAFDTKRKRLALFRQRPDAIDGACQCQLEFYRPLYRAARLTEPVPVSPLRPGKPVRFVAHLIGTNGEGVAGYMVSAALEAPALGVCLTPTARSEVCGKLTFRYQGPEAGIDTLKLTATLTDGQDA